MITMAQRISQLRDQTGLSRPALAASLGFARNSIEKFETGRLTPTKEQQEKLAGYFGVSLSYLRCESDDPTRQGTWMDAAWGSEAEEAAPSPRPAGPEQSGQEGGLFHSLLGSRAFGDQLRGAVLEALRSPEGQELLAKAVRRELARRA